MAGCTSCAPTRRRATSPAVTSSTIRAMPRAWSPRRVRSTSPRARPASLEGPNQAPIAFEAELLDADSCDLSLTLELSEAVVVTRDVAGGYAARHLADDRDGDDRFPDTCGARLWTLVLGDELVAAKAAP